MFSTRTKSFLNNNKKQKVLNKKKSFKQEQKVF